ncbi:DNA polymerase III subunit epsilon [Malaciobacter molluscorum LMG 25693]|uniref:DEDDh 3'-5' exonuclease domain family protein n=1 Tax=Malaciobacter molluscorum LMG 25693 TaxID=870501 RepID=A0A2G1DKP5_9BACT|nr:3'-5' exonuclease [Malaciobacter molluscorum]AXX92559.1 DEDDh 3'-5' exonuclease domain family protein [Malaciobacter molluscorum LMG 25693]PHO18984.1 DNA polymerase III subunit epsilon [Malaciobacter molluscorum LMG 25693]
MPKYVLFDTETTGNQEEDKIIQFGAMIVEQNGSLTCYDELCYTQEPIKLEAMEVHNITPNMIEGKPKATETEFYKKLIELNNEENYLIAHNINFDLGMIQKEGFENKYQLIDTLRCAKHLFPQMPYHRLQYLRYALELYKVEEQEAKKNDIIIKAHDAIGDVLVMKLFLSKLVKECRNQYSDYNPMEKLAELTKTPVFINTFKFGKYKGKEVIEVAKEDAGYLNWMRSNLDLDEDLKYTLDKVLSSL